MKTIICVIFVLLTFSCSTIKTVEPLQNHVAISHGNNKSYCKTIPRIYSGIATNICILYGESNKSAGVDATTHSFHYWVIDSAFSVVFDTVILPYTIVSQLNNGSIQVN